MKRLLFVLLLVVVAGSLCNALTERDVKTLVEEYVSANTKDERRQEILLTLAADNPLLAQRTLKTVIGDEETRPHALKLAALLRVPGLYTTAKKYIDTIDEELVLDLIISTQDSDGMKFLIDRWKKAELDSVSFGLLQGKFKKSRIRDLDRLQDLVEQMEKEERGDYAAEIVGFQLGLSNPSKEDLTTAWTAYQKEYKTLGAPFRLQGQDLLIYAWKGNSCQTLGYNFKVKAGGRFYIERLPDTVQSGDFTLKARIYIGDGDGAYVGFYDANGLFKPTVKGSEWNLTTGDANVFALPLTRNKWTEVEIKVHDVSKGNEKMRRYVQFYMDGKLLANKETNLAFNGEIGKWEFAAGEGDIVIGGFELIHS